MTFKKQIELEYFEWLYDYVCKGRVNNNVSYKKLFMFLHETEFSFRIRNDVNRARDGVDLRYRYAINLDDYSVLDILDKPCSVLEMMVALAIRCEETIMDDPSYGDRTGQWFWNMISNLGVKLMTDDIFDEEFVGKKICDFLNRNYEADGKGGLFYIKGCKDDLREVEIWTQLCWYLDVYY